MGIVGMPRTPPPRTASPLPGAYGSDGAGAGVHGAKAMTAASAPNTPPSMAKGRMYMSHGHNHTTHASSSYLDVPQVLLQRIREVDTRMAAAKAVEAKAQRRCREGSLLNHPRFKDWRRRRQSERGSSVGDGASSVCTTPTAGCPPHPEGIDDGAPTPPRGGMFIAGGYSSAAPATSPAARSTASSRSAATSCLRFAPPSRDPRRPMSHTEALAVFKTLHELPQTHSLVAWMDKYRAQLAHKVLDVQVVECHARNAIGWQEEAGITLIHTRWAAEAEEPRARALLVVHEEDAFDALVIEEARAFAVVDGISISLGASIEDTDTTANATPTPAASDATTTTPDALHTQEEWVRGVIEDRAVVRYTAIVDAYSTGRMCILEAAAAAAAARPDSAASSAAAAAERQKRADLAAGWSSMDREIAALMAGVDGGSTAGADDDDAKVDVNADDAAATASGVEDIPPTPASTACAASVTSHDITFGSTIGGACGLPRRKPPPPAWCVDHPVHRFGDAYAPSSMGAGGSIRDGGVSPSPSASTGAGSVSGFTDLSSRRTTGGRVDAVAALKNAEAAARRGVAQDEARQFDAVTTQADLAVMRAARAVRVKFELAEREGRAGIINARRDVMHELGARAAAAGAVIAEYLAYAAEIPGELDVEEQPRRTRIVEEEGIERMVLLEKTQYIAARAARERDYEHIDLAVADGVAARELEARVRVELAFTASLEAMVKEYCALPLQLTRLSVEESERRGDVVAGYLYSTWGIAPATGTATAASATTTPTDVDGAPQTTGRPPTQIVGDFTLTDCIRPLLIHVGSYGEGMTTGEVLPFPPVIQRYIDVAREARFGCAPFGGGGNAAGAADADDAADAHARAGVGGDGAVNAAPAANANANANTPPFYALEFQERTRREELVSVEAQVVEVMARHYHEARRAHGWPVNKRPPRGGDAGDGRTANTTATAAAPLPPALALAVTALCAQHEAEAARVARAETRAWRSLLQLFAAAKPKPPPPGLPHDRGALHDICAAVDAARDDVAALEAQTRTVIVNWLCAAVAGDDGAASPTFAASPTASPSVIAGSGTTGPGGFTKFLGIPSDVLNKRAVDAAGAQAKDPEMPPPPQKNVPPRNHTPANPVECDASSSRTAAATVAASDTGYTPAAAPSSRRVAATATAAASAAVAPLDVDTLSKPIVIETKRGGSGSGGGGDDDRSGDADGSAGGRSATASPVAAARIPDPTIDDETDESRATTHAAHLEEASAVEESPSAHTPGDGPSTSARGGRGPAEKDAVDEEVPAPASSTPDRSAAAAATALRHGGGGRDAEEQQQQQQQPKPRRWRRLTGVEGRDATASTPATPTAAVVTDEAATAAGPAAAMGCEQPRREAEGTTDDAGDDGSTTAAAPLASLPRRPSTTGGGGGGDVAPAPSQPRPPSGAAPPRPRPASAPKGVFLTLREQRALAKKAVPVAGTDASTSNRQPATQ